LAGEEEIIVRVGNVLAMRWVNNSRFVEALALCQSILTICEDYRILRVIGKAEVVMGFVDEALEHYQQALNQCPDNALKEKAYILEAIAGAIADRGEINRALNLYQQSFVILEHIDDFQGKALVLSGIANVIARNGEIDRALELWQQSLEISDCGVSVQGNGSNHWRSMRAFSMLQVCLPPSITWQ